MPFSSELGMTIYDPLSAYESGQPAAAVAARAFERGQSEADKARALLKRNMAAESMRIRAAELYSHMEQTPENENLAQRQAFLEYAPGIYGEERGMAEGINQLLRSDEANLIRQNANEALARRAEEARTLQRELAGARNQISMLELTRKSKEDAMDATIARERLEATKNKLPIGLAEDAAIANYRGQADALKILVESNPQNAALKRMLQSTNYKIQSWEQRHAKDAGGATGQASAAGKYAQELRNARQALETAYSTGDPDKRKEAELYYKDLQSAMEKLHPSKQAAARVSMLMSTYRETLRAYLAGDKKLKPDVDRLKREIDAMGNDLDAKAATSENTTRRFRFIPGSGIQPVE